MYCPGAPGMRQAYNGQITSTKAPSSTSHLQYNTPPTPSFAWHSSNQPSQQPPSQMGLPIWPAIWPDHLPAAQPQQQIDLTTLLSLQQLLGACQAGPLVLWMAVCSCTVQVCPQT